MSSQNTYQQGGSTSSSRVGIGKRRAAPYGQACLHCFKTKSKCVRQSSVESCERCIRLKKQCSPADSLRKRSSQKPSSTTATIANLQAEIEELKRRVPFAGNSASLDVLPDLVKRPTEDYGDYKAKSEEKDAQLDSTATSITSNEWDLSPDQERTRLEIFRDQMLKFFPFVHLPDGLTADQLHKDKPLLFQAIMTVTSPSTQEKRARATQLKRNLAQEAVEYTETSLDLLLCILTYVAWGYDNFIFKLKSPSRLTQLAISMAYDLRLHKPESKESNLFPNETLPHDQQAPELAQESLEGKRAVLGCFMLSSQVSSHYGRMEPMRWTPQMEDSLSAISRNPFCPTDEMFAWQIRLQLLIQQANEQRDQRELDRYPATANSKATASATPSSSKDPLLHKWYFEALQTKLHELRASIPPHLTHHEILLSHIHFASLSICETIHPINTDSKTSQSFNVTTAFDERDVHYHSLQAIKDFYENFNHFTSADYTGFSLSMWCQTLLNNMVLFRLSLNPAYRDAVRHTVDVLRESYCVAEKLEGAAVEMRESAPEDLFTVLYHISRAFHNYAARWLNPTPRSQQPLRAKGQDVSFTGPESWTYSASDSGVDIGPADPYFIPMLDMFGLNASPPQMLGGIPGVLGDSTIYCPTYV
ncbi:hypothetical protein BDV12DRAFT_72234 [Aspergillus spectabilis]